MPLISIPEEETITPVSRPRLKIVGKEYIVARPTKYIPIIPTGDGCCPEICRNINNNIENATKKIIERKKELGAITSRHVKMKIRRQGYYFTNALYVLEDFRVKMKDNKVCECIKDIE